MKNWAVLREGVIQASGVLGASSQVESNRVRSGSSGIKLDQVGSSRDPGLKIA